ncbi:N-acetylmuramoyl-L-alanine amidase [Streptomyces sp. GESEQ-35]|uniref:N-acetylmuramoyl-L-alanine amidase n=1 Tax=Streptomyces sp. GESEQ-35 TaxID=2812657 RepID=UPI001FF6BCE4|nr:N-acetylmuramoyl-L-alanine amidase [Streptomyces sp. GESEQ-35]
MTQPRSRSSQISRISRRALLGALGTAVVVPGLSACSSAHSKHAARLPDSAHRTVRLVRNFVPRAEWGADESKRFKEDGTESSQPKFFPLQALTVHHTATANDDPSPDATVRTMYEKHTVDEDWGDIGYHFLVAPNGRVYEGRYSGDDAMPAHDGDGNLVTAFHTTGFNSGNLGIALLGDLDARPPTDAAVDALTQLLTVLTRMHRLDPRAQIAYRNPVDGTTKEAITVVSGHRDWYETECPGAQMYGKLDALRRAVSAQLTR